MRTCKVRLTTVSDVHALVHLVNNCSYAVELISGRHIVDAKSMMGIFSLDLSKPITLCAHFDDTDQLFAELGSLRVSAS